MDCVPSKSPWVQGLTPGILLRSPRSGGSPRYFKDDHSVFARSRAYLCRGWSQARHVSQHEAYEVMNQAVRNLRTWLFPSKLAGKGC